MGQRTGEQAQCRSAANRQLTRRQALTGIGAAVMGAIAGCGGLSNDQPDELEYTVLHQTPTYVADDVALAVPDEIPAVSARNNADLLVLPGDTDASPEQAVDWLAADRTVALVGTTAESTWIGWVRSDAYADTFDDQGVADSEPDPQLLVAAAVGLRVPTYRHSWGNPPSDRDILEALDETLADVETRAPQ
jgi:hypothetical protein